MNQFDASASPMFECFQEKPDLTPYTAAPALVALDQMNPETTAIADPVLQAGRGRFRPQSTSAKWTALRKTCSIESSGGRCVAAAHPIQNGRSPAMPRTTMMKSR